MPNYQEGKIYSIRSASTDKFYIGSTCQPLHKRLFEHRRQYKCYLNGKNNYVSSFALIENGDEYIELIENYPCKDKNELHKREGEIIRKNKGKCVNQVVAGALVDKTKKEYMVIYRKENMDKILVSVKSYYENHKDEIRERGRRKVHCICGVSYGQKNPGQHKRSQHHQQYQQYIDYCEKHDPLMFEAIQIHQRVKSH
jgi:hypothetical protein